MSDNNISPDTMPLPALITALVERCGVTESVAGSFVTAFTETVVAALRTDNNVKIKGIGRFSTDRQGNIIFEADAAIADKINAPFSIFEPVEIDGSELSEEIADMENPAEMDTPTTNPGDAENGETLQTSDNPEPEATVLKPATSEQPVANSTEEATVNADKDPAEELCHRGDINPEPDFEPQSEPFRDSGPGVTETKGSAPYMWDENDKAPEPRVVKVIVREHPWLTGILAGIAGLLIGLGCGYFLYPRLNFTEATSVELSAGVVNVTPDSIPQGPTTRNGLHIAEHDIDTLVTNATQTADTAPAAKQAIVRDTIRRNRFLTTMARDHYGRKIFWVYIYEENKDVISDPDNIAPNTVVVIPPAEKYGIKAGDKLSEQAAERKAFEIIEHNR